MTSPNCQQNHRVYRDYAHVSESMLSSVVVTDTTRAASKKEIETKGPVFAERMYYMLTEMEKDGLEDVISWLPHGRAFRVHQRDVFEREYLPLWFRQTKYVSLQRQLTLHGFSCIRSGIDQGAYCHELFLRSKPFLAKFILPRPRALSCHSKKHSKNAAKPLPQRSSILLVNVVPFRCRELPDFYKHSFMPSSERNSSNTKTDKEAEEETVIKLQSCKSSVDKKDIRSSIMASSASSATNVKSISSSTKASRSSSWECNIEDSKRKTVRVHTSHSRFVSHTNSKVAKVPAVPVIAPQPAYGLPSACSTVAAPISDATIPFLSTPRNNSLLGLVRPAMPESSTAALLSIRRLADMPQSSVQPRASALGGKDSLTAIELFIRQTQLLHQLNLRVSGSSSSTTTLRDVAAEALSPLCAIDARLSARDI